MLAEHSRGGDIMISSGGGNFLVLLPVTSQQGAGQIAERIRETLVTHMFPDLENDCVRIVFGVATTGKGIDSPAELLAAASNALDQAKPTKDPKIAV